MGRRRKSGGPAGQIKAERRGLYWFRRRTSFVDSRRPWRHQALTLQTCAASLKLRGAAKIFPSNITARFPLFYQTKPMRSSIGAKRQKFGRATSERGGKIKSVPGASLPNDIAIPHRSPGRQGWRSRAPCSDAGVLQEGVRAAP